jgi:hypothetical protein
VAAEFVGGVKGVGGGSNKRQLVWRNEKKDDGIVYWDGDGVIFRMGCRMVVFAIIRSLFLSALLLLLFLKIRMQSPLGMGGYQINTTHLTISS